MDASFRNRHLTTKVDVQEVACWNGASKIKLNIWGITLAVAFRVHAVG
jgi:hypothetical protein